MLLEPACGHRGRAAANESVPIALIGRHPACDMFWHTGQEEASVTNLGFRGGLEAYPSLQRYWMICYLRKKRKKKNWKKEEKEKPTTSREEYELACIPEARRRKAKLTTAVIAWRRRSVKVLPEKIMPAGLHFRCANGAAAWPWRAVGDRLPLQEFLFLWRIINVSCTTNYKKPYLCPVIRQSRIADILLNSLLNHHLGVLRASQHSWHLRFGVGVPILCYGSWWAQKAYGVPTPFLVLG